MPQVGDIKSSRELGYKGRHKHIWHACLTCGKERWVGLEKGKPISLRCRLCAHKFCMTPELRGRISLAMKGKYTGKKSGNWKGGRHITNRSYVEIKLFPSDPFYTMADKRGYVLEHRLVIAQSLGRCLTPREIVHHKGVRHSDAKNRSDNLEDNLELTATIGEHISNHSKGYKDGFQKGYADGLKKALG